jgi:hypothetical protein
MTTSALSRDELIQLIEELRKGRSEDESLECKRAWWPLTQGPDKDEFCKDIAAMANSARGTGYILVGYKSRSLHPAPMNRDEAELQSIVASGIQPTPTVSFTVHEIEGVEVTLVAIAPTSRPHVLETAAGSFSVPVRRGSRVGTAARHDLDLFYRTPAPSLQAAWGEAANQHRPAHLRGATLVLPSHRGTAVDAYKTTLGQLAEEHRATGRPTALQLRQYEQELTSFLDCLRDHDCLAHWELVSGSPRAVTVDVTNVGRAPASDLRVELTLPSWLRATSDPPTSHKGPSGYSPPPKRPRPRHLESPSLPWLHHIGALAPRAAGSFVDGSKIVFWRNEALHTHTYSFPDLWLTALTNAPVGDPHIINGTLFAREFEAREEVLLTLLVDRD